MSCDTLLAESCRTFTFSIHLLQAISVIVTHCTDDMSRLPSQIATTNVPVEQKPQEARLKLRLNPAPAAAPGAVANGPAEGASSGPSTSGAAAADVVMQQEDAVPTAGAVGPSVLEGVGSPGSDKAGPGRAGAPPAYVAACLLSASALLQLQELR